MKISFMKQCPDDILKENHQLRRNIVLIKQQVKNFQDSMIAFIRQSRVQVPVANTPHQNLTLFMQTINTRISEYQMRIKKYEVNIKILNKTNDQLQLQNQQFKKQRVQSQKREIKLKQQMDTIQKRYYDLFRNFSQYSLQQETLKQEIKSIKQKSIIERSILEQIKKKQIEVAKLTYHHQFVQLRNKIQQSNLQLQDKYKVQIIEKENRIKQLEKLVESLAVNIKQGPSKKDIISPTIQLFQQSNRSRKTIYDLKQQNNLMMKALNSIQREKLELQSKIMQKNIELHKFQSQFDQQTIEKLEIEKKLAAKMKQIQKQKNDKHVMEQYYEKKWNSDYKKVKAQLQKSFLQKNQEFQKAFAIRVQQFEVKVVEWLEKVNVYERKNKQLERIHNLDFNEKQILKKEIDKLLIQMQRLNSQLSQTWRMSREQILCLKVMHLQQEKFYSQQIRVLSQKLEKYQSHLVIQSERIENEIKNLNQKHQIQLKKQLQNQKKKHDIQIENLINNYEGKIIKLKEQIHLQTIKIQKVKQDITQQFQKQTQIIKQRHQKQVKQKEDDMQKKLEKASHKLKDYEYKTILTRKQHEETLLVVEKSKTQLQKCIQELKIQLKNCEIELKLGNGDKNQLLELNSQLNKKICTLELTIQKKDRQIWDAKLKQKQHQDIAQQLTRKRDQWLNQLIELQRTYQKDFEQLKNTFNRQSNIYKSKIWQLERQYKNQLLSKKNYDKILCLNSEKEQLKNALEIKEAENIVLSQVNEIYETQLRISQDKFNKTQFKQPSAIFTRKVDRHRKFTQIKITSKNNTDSKDIVKMKKYIKNSYKKQQYMSLAKAGYKQVSFFERIKTNPV